jgi:hypothetical protein
VLEVIKKDPDSKQSREVAAGVTKEHGHIASREEVAFIEDDRKEKNGEDRGETRPSEEGEQIENKCDETADMLVIENYNGDEKEGETTIQEFTDGQEFGDLEQCRNTIKEVAYSTEAHAEINSCFGDNTLQGMEQKYEEDGGNLKLLERFK